MKVVISIDSFKGSLTSIQAAQAIEKGIKRVEKEAEVVIKPLADGGEGTVDALVDGMYQSYGSGRKASVSEIRNYLSNKSRYGRNKHSYHGNVTGSRNYSGNR